MFESGTRIQHPKKDIYAFATHHPRPVGHIVVVEDIGHLLHL